MKNVIYRATLTPAYKSPDGETPDCIYLTEEANGFAIWRVNHAETMCIELSYFRGRDESIERAVKIASNLRSAS